MPRKTIKSKTKKTTTRKPRKTTRRKKSNPIDAFWTKVINGMKKLLSPAFPK